MFWPQMCLVFLPMKWRFWKVLLICFLVIHRQQVRNYLNLMEVNGQLSWRGQTMKALHNKTMYNTGHRMTKISPGINAISLEKLLEQNPTFGFILQRWKHIHQVLSVDSVIWEKNENKGNQQTDFSLRCCLLLFQKPAQPDKHYDEVVSTSFAKLFDKPFWLIGVYGNAQE